MCLRRLLLPLLLLAGFAVRATEPSHLLPAPLLRVLAPRWSEVAAERAANAAALTDLPPAPHNQPTARLGFHSSFARQPKAVKWLQIDLGAAREFDAVVLVAAEAAEDSAPGPGYGFPMRFRVESADDEHFARHRLLADATEADFPNPATLPVFLPCPATTARYIRVTATRLGPRGRSWLFALGELMVLNGSRNLAAGCPVSASDAYRATPAWQAENATDGHTALGAPAGPPVSSTNGWHSAISPVAEGEKWVEVRLPRAAALDELRLYPARPADFPTRSGFGFPVRFRVEASATHDFAQPRTLLDATAADFLNPGENTVVIPGAAEPVQTIRVTATRLWERSGDFVFALAELEAWSGGKNLAAGAEVVSSDGVVNRVWNPAALVDGATSRWTIADWRPWLQALSERRERELRAVALAAELAQLEKAAQGRFGRWLGAGGGMLFLVGTAVVWSARRHRALAAERLRERIAADLHDEIGSQLASIALLSQVAQRREPCASAAVLAEIQSIARETSEAMRDIVWLVRPSPGSVEELVARLREVARRLLGETPWTLETTALPLTLPLEVRRHVYLFAREALRNAAAHSSAPSVQIHLSAADRHLELTIHDDGAGFDPATPVEGTGLLSLRQRAAELGGELQIDTALGTGTRLALRIPLRES